MPKKPPGWRQAHTISSQPRRLAEPHESSKFNTKGDDHAVQNHHSGTAEGTEELHEQLRQSRKLLPTLEPYARELKASHEVEGDAGRRSRTATRARSRAKRWSWPSRIWRIVCPPSRIRTRTNRSRSTKQWLQSSVLRRRVRPHATNQPFRFPASDALPLHDPPPADTRPPPPAAACHRSQCRRNAPPGQPTGNGRIASGEKAKARDIIAAIRTLKRIETERRPPNKEEKDVLARFSGFGPVALSIFPDPVTGRYKDAGWQALGEELKTLLTPQEYDSAKRTTFNAFYTSPTVIASIHEAIARLGVPGQRHHPRAGLRHRQFHEPGQERQCGSSASSSTPSPAASPRHFIPSHDIRIENFRDTRLPEGSIDAAIGNVPFADLKLDYRGQKLSLHDFFFAKSVDALKPGGVLALVTSHYTLDKQNAAIREYLGSKADFVGAIRLPSDAFKREGTAVVTDILFLRKRAPGEPARHVDPHGWALPRFPSRAQKSPSTATSSTTLKWS